MSIFKRKVARKDTPATSASVAPSSYMINPFGVSGTMAAYKYGSYDNTFPSVCRIAETFMTVLPFAVDDKGERIDPAPSAIQALYKPNREMSVVDFIETLIVCALVHPCVHILVTHVENGKTVLGANGITPDNINGYLFLEDATRVVTNGVVTYQTTSGVFTDSDVITIRLNANPYSVLSGYSPSIASMKWSRLDDFMADYQAGFFRNGACPAGQFIITANTVDEYNEIVDKIKGATLGVEKNNKLLFTHRPVPMVGGAAPAQIEWVPFSEKNKDIALKDLFEQVNRKIDMTFGVPSEVNGFVQNSNYASVSTADYIFSRRVIYPKLVKVWSRFTHELNRITGGLGYVISFDYEIPTLADETKIKAETNQIDLDSFLKAVQAGYSPEMAVKGLDLPERFLEFKSPKAPEPEHEENAPADDSKSLACTCGHHHKDLGDTDDLDIDLITRASDDRAVRLMQDHVEEMINDSIQDGKAKKPDKKALKALKIALVALLLASADEVGAEVRTAATQRLLRDGVPVPNNVADAKFTRTEELYQERINKLSETLANFDAETARQIDGVFRKAKEAGWDQQTIVATLHGLLPDNQWRIVRLTQTELFAVDNIAWIDALSQLDEAIDTIKIYKTWHIHDTDACENCTALDGVRIPIAEPFVPQNTRMANGDLNTYTTVDAPLLHPNCRCSVSWDFEWINKAVSVKCPKCGRYLMDAYGCNIKNMICTNTSCKARLKITACNGQIKCEEIPKESQA